MDIALKSLKIIIPLLDKYKFTWVITGGFAVIAYGINRPLSDIDIDIKTSKDSPDFQAFVAELMPYISQELLHWTDENYDNYNFEVTIEGQLIDICPMQEMKLINVKSGEYEHFYDENFNDIEYIGIGGLRLPLLSKKMIIKNKERLSFQRDIDRQDIEALKMLSHG